MPMKKHEVKLYTISRLMSMCSLRAIHLQPYHFYTQ